MHNSHCRMEVDAIGEMPIPDGALFGIHSQRAKINFCNNTPFQVEWYKAMGLVKQACFATYKTFKQAAVNKVDSADVHLSFMDDEVLDALIVCAQKMSEGQWFDHFIVPAIQGGAGTSINMNVNEILANAALMHLNDKPGNYLKVDPIEQANVFQSTNDVVPTALKVALMKRLLVLEAEINRHRLSVEQTESSCRNLMRQAYTQMQEAVPSSYDKLFSTYNNALSRDWWRVSKCLERIKEVNLGGGAVGTGLAIPRFFIMNVVGELQKITNLPVSRSENMSDTTANLDSFVEVHATLKAHAVNLEKMVSDIRLMGSDLFKNRQLHLPRMQVGSSIMPGKINPVIPEFVISSVHKVYANDMLISNLSGQGCLDLNAYLPVIGHALLESVNLLIHANQACVNGLYKGLTIDANQHILSPVFYSPSITTALSPYVGYHKAGLLAHEMQQHQCSVFDANKNLNLLSDSKLAVILSPNNLMKLGFSLSDIVDNNNG